MNNDVVTYYNSLEILLEDIRETGTFGTHFGISDEKRSDYCFFKASCLPKIHISQHEYLATGMENLYETIFAPYNSKQNILDVGCGVGGILKKITARWPDARCSGININQEQLRIAKDHLKNTNVELICQDFLSETFAAKNYDLIYFVESAFHISNKLKLVERVHSLLSHDGELAIIDIYFSDKIYKRLNPNSPTRAVFNYLSLQAWRDLFAHHDIEITNFQDLSLSAANTIQVSMSESDFLEKIVASKLHKINSQNEEFIKKSLMIFNGYKKLYQLLVDGTATYGIIRAKRKKCFN